MTEEEDLEQGIRACLPIEGAYDQGGGYIETDRQGIDDIVASLKTFILEREQRVASTRPMIAAPTRLPGSEDFGSTTAVVEGQKVTTHCTDCGTVLLQYSVPPGAYLPRLAHPYVMCCGKLRRIGP